MLELREVLRTELAALLGVDPALVALTDSTTRGCATVLAGLGLTDEDEVVTTDQEHFGLTGPLYATGARIVIVDADEDALLAAVTRRTRLLATSHVLWTTGRRLDLAHLKRGERAAAARRRRAVGRRDPRSTRSRSTSTPSPRRSGCAGPSRPGALYVRDPERLRIAAPELPGAVGVRARPARSRRRTARPASTRAGSRVPVARRPRRRARHASGVAVRARGRDRGALPRAAGRARRGR